MIKTTNKFPPEVRERAVRMVLDSEAARAIGSSGTPNGQHESRWSAILSISAKNGRASQTLNEWIKWAEVDTGKRAGIPSDLAGKTKALEREVRELRQANEILRKASA
jgi:transposase